jgi:hypothetical protein
VTLREVLEAMRWVGKSRDIPIVVVSGVSDALRELDGTAVFAALLKPVRIAALVAVIEQARAAR